jgi:hypothetical protein
MQPQNVKLIDQSRNVVATAQVVDKGAYYGGTIDLRQTPASLRALFEEFEEVVNGQMFSFVDEIDDRISTFCIKAVFDSGQEAFVKDLQVFPGAGDVSFKLAEIPASPAEQVPEGTQASSADLPEEALHQLADELFRSYDAEEAARAKPSAR